MSCMSAVPSACAAQLNDQNVILYIQIPTRARARAVTLTASCVSAVHATSPLTQRRVLRPRCSDCVGRQPWDVADLPILRRLRFVAPRVVSESWGGGTYLVASAMIRSSVVGCVARAFLRRNHGVFLPLCLVAAPLLMYECANAPLRKPESLGEDRSEGGHLSPRLR